MPQNTGPSVLLTLIGKPVGKALFDAAKCSPFITFLLSLSEGLYTSYTTFTEQQQEDLLELCQNADIDQLIADNAELRDQIRELEAFDADIRNKIDGILDVVPLTLNHLQANQSEIFQRIALAETALVKLQLDEKQHIELARAIQFAKDDPLELIRMPRKWQPQSNHIDATSLIFHRQLIDMVGREAEDMLLEQFIADERPFCWWCVEGPGGIGKTRWAWEWLLRLKQMGWKTGFLDYERLPKFREKIGSLSTLNLPAAIVIDYGHRSSKHLPNLLDKLDEVYEDISQNNGESPAALRILVLDRSGMAENTWLNQNTCSENNRTGLIRSYFQRDKSTDLQGLGKTLHHPHMLSEITSKQDQLHIIHQVMHRIGVDSALAQDRIASLTEEQIAGLTGNRPLLLTMLGIYIAENIGTAPVALTRDDLLDDCIFREVERHWRQYCGLNVSAWHEQLVADVGFITLCNGIDTLKNLPRSTFHRGKDYRDTLKSVLGTDGNGHIAPMLPDLLGERFLLTGGEPEKSRDQFFDASEWVSNALRLSPAGLAHTLSRMFQDFPDDTQPYQWLEIGCKKLLDKDDETITAAFLPASVAAAIILGLKNTDITTQKWYEYCWKLAQHNVVAAEFWSRIALWHIHLADQADNREALEAWGARLSAIRHNELLSSNATVALAEVNAVLFAVGNYGKIKAWEQLETWGNRILCIRKNKILGNDLAIARVEVHIINSVIQDYCAAKELSAVEKWGCQLDIIRGHGDFKADDEIAKLASNLAVLVISYCGEAEKWECLEVWGQRLQNIRESAYFKNDPSISYSAVSAAYFALYSYGKVKNWKYHEAWGDRLKAVREHEIFKDDSAIALAEAKAAVNAIAGYGEAKEWVALEAWGDRLKTVREHQIFKDDPAIALAAAQAVVDAIDSYRKAKQWEALEKWLERLLDICLLFPYDANILAIAFLGFPLAVHDHPTNNTCNLLLRAAFLAPGLQPATIEKPILIEMIALSREQKNWPPFFLHETSEMERKYMQAQKALKSCIRDGQFSITSEEEFQSLWDARRFLHGWGKWLIPAAVENGGTEYIKEALGDAWYSPAEREDLKKLLEQAEAAKNTKKI